MILAVLLETSLHLNNKKDMVLLMQMKSFNLGGNFAHPTFFLRAFLIYFRFVKIKLKKT